MQEIQRRRLVDGSWVIETHVVYGPGEAKEIEPIPWRHARKAGEWVVDEGGYVSKTISVKRFMVGRGRRTEAWRVVLPYGRFFTNGRLPLSYADIIRQPRKDYASVEARTSRVKRMVRVYAKMYLERSGRLTEEDFRQLGIIYRADQKVPGASAKRVLKISQVQSMVADELIKLLDEGGFTRAEVIKRYNELYVDAKNSSQLSVAKGILDRMADMLDMKPDVKRLSAGISFGDRRSLPDVDWETPPELEESYEDE